MDIFNVLSLIGGLCLFLFGMNIMGSALASQMSGCAMEALRDGIRCLYDFSPALAATVKDREDQTDKWEDMIGSYLVKLSAEQLSDSDSTEAAKLLKIIGDLERIGDHALNFAESDQRMLHIHASQRHMRTEDPDYKARYAACAEKYL